MAARPVVEYKLTGFQGNLYRPFKFNRCVEPIPLYLEVSDIGVLRRSLTVLDSYSLRFSESASM